MAPSAYALVVLFASVALGTGLLATRVVGPWRPWSWVAPSAAAFAALYLIGHRFDLSVGPKVPVFGWEVALPFDVAVALATAFTTALVQAALVRLLQPQQTRAGGDGLP